MTSSNVQQSNSSLNSYDIVSPFGADPFIGHLSTPITTSSLTKSYLNLLPIYKTTLSPLLKGINIGFAHGYFLLGPFVNFGPLRNSEIASFIGYLSTIGLIFILTGGLIIYGITSFSNKEKSIKYSLNILNKNGWNQLTSGFFIGGFTGASIAYLILKQYFSI
jgi:photosystem I subunit 11